MEDPRHVAGGYPTGLLRPLIVERIPVQVLLPPWVDEAAVRPVKLVLVFWLKDQMLASKDEDYEKSNLVD